MVKMVNTWTVEGEGKPQFTNLTPLTAIPPPPPDTDLINATGLGLMAKVLRFYGFHIGPKGEPTFSYIHLLLAVSFSLAIVLVDVLVLIYQLSHNLNFSMPRISLWAIVFLIVIRVPFNFVHGIRHFRNLAAFLNAICLTIHSISHPPLRQYCIQKIRRSVTVSICFFLLAVFFGAYLTMYAHEFLILKILEETHASVDDYAAYITTCKIASVIWHLFGNSFSMYFSTIITISCKVLLMCFDSFMLKEGSAYHEVASRGQSSAYNGYNAEQRQPTDQDEGCSSVRQRQLFHQHMCGLVNDANQLFSTLLFASLVEQIIILILYSRVDHNFTWLAGFLSLRHTVVFVLNTFQCSSVNDRIVEALELAPRKPSEMQVCSPEDINYLLYITQFPNRNVYITYGNVFPVRKSFLFTMAGTILTYMLVLKDF